MKKILKTKTAHCFRQTALMSAIAASFGLSSASLFAANSPFAKVPLHLQAEVTSTTSKAKPNLMLFLDDSASMESLVGNTSRLEATKKAVNAILDSYGSDFHWGLQTLYPDRNPSVNTRGFVDAATIKRRYLPYYQSVGNTPTTRRYLEVSQMVADNIQYRCQNSYIILMSDGDANDSCRVNQVGAGRGAFYTIYTPRYAPTYYSKAYRFFGIPSSADYQANWDRCIDKYGTNAFWDRNNGLGFFSKQLAERDVVTAASGYLDGDGKSWDAPDFPKQTIQTYTIGFGGGISQAGETYLRNGAAGSGFYSAPKTAQELEDTFAKMVESIRADNQQNAGLSKFANVAPMVAGDPDSEQPSAVPGMALSVSLNTSSWSSMLRFHKIKDGGIDTSTYQTPDFSQRRLIVNKDGRNAYWHGAPFLSNADFGIPSTQGNTNANEWDNQLWKWLLRSGISGNNDDNAIANSGPKALQYRVRSTSPENERDMGDIIDTPVVAIGDSKTGNRQRYLVTAANDGMVYLFQSSDDVNHPYTLKLNYLPASMQREAIDASDNMSLYLKDIAHPEYGKTIDHPHQYMINGGLVVRETDAQKGKNQQIFMAGNMGQGGRGMFALNVGGKKRNTGAPVGLDTNQESWPSTVPLFETEKGESNKLGYTVSTPAIGRIAPKRSVSNQVDLANGIVYGVFLASGYHHPSSSQETALYVYQGLNQDVGISGSDQAAQGVGALLGKIIVPDAVGGLSSPTLVDVNFDGVVDIAYAGDYAGNMYRFDLRKASSSEWTATKIYSGLPTQPITAAPATLRLSDGKYVVVFGTGSDMYQSDLEDRSQQALYGIYDDVFVSNPRAATQSDLLLREMKDESDNTRLIASIKGKTEVELAESMFEPSNGSNGIAGKKNGWYINLHSDGERIVVKPDLQLRTAIVTTRSYAATQESTSSGNSNAVCSISTSTKSVQGSGWILQVNAATGGTINGTRKEGTSFLDFTNDTKNKDFVKGQYLAFNGYRLGSGIPSLSMLTGANTMGSSVTLNGDSGGSGTDPELNPAGKAPQNSCWKGGNNKKAGVGDSETGFNKILDLYGSSCQVQIKRISWREIF